MSTPRAAVRHERISRTALYCSGWIKCFGCLQYSSHQESKNVARRYFFSPNQSCFWVVWIAHSHMQRYGFSRNQLVICDWPSSVSRSLSTAPHFGQTVLFSHTNLRFLSVLGLPTSKIYTYLQTLHLRLTNILLGFWLILCLGIRGYALRTTVRQ